MKYWGKFQKNELRLQYILVVIFFGFIAYSVPLTGDDWTWATHIGIDRLNSSFENYNGRYVSNILEIIVTRVEWLRILIATIISTLLVFTTAKITEKKDRKVSVLLSFFLFIMIPTKIFSQTFGWTAGYVNYIPSIVLLLIYLLIVKNIMGEETPTYNKNLNYLVILLGLITPLIVEHVTLFALYTGFLVIVYTYLKHKKHYLVHWAYFISTIIGSIVMFTNGAYLRVLSGQDTYRSVKENTGILHRFYSTYKESMYQFLFSENVLVQLIISVLVILLLLRATTPKKRIENGLKILFLFVIVGFDLFILIFKGILGNEYLGIYTLDFEAIFSIIYFLTICISVLLFIQERTSKIKLIYYLSGVILLIIPFVFIAPFGPRCVFGTYTFMVLFILELLSYLETVYDWSYTSLKKVLFISNLLVMIALGFIIGMNGYADRMRIQKLENDLQQKAKVIEISELPYPQFHQMSSPRPGWYQATTFKILYKIPNDVEIKVVPYFQIES
ncbi:DUF6056 family protein [Priestia aryabhattai]|uniref:DUF6056 family protein n=1 Tax=Priestia aryabhattai TaxID=412384 RepID=UPI003D2D84F2